MAISIGFHVSVGGNMTGIGRHMEELDAAGIPFGLVSIGNYGPIGEGVLLMRASNVAHVLIYRVTDLDVPNYDLDPATAALRHWDGYKAKLPPEFDKTRVWLCPINEVDKGRADWLGDFATAFAALAMGEGYMVTMFAWSSGEPEPEHWQTAGMRRYLELCALHPDKAAVALHEYSYTLEDIRHEFPYKIGRFQALFDACDAMGIARPTVHITEWGWTHEEVPEPVQAMLDLDWAYRLYGPYPQIKIVVIWYLGSDFAGIANLAQKLIAPVTHFMLNAPVVNPTPPPIVPPPAPPPAPPPTTPKRVIIASTAGSGNLRLEPSTTSLKVGNAPNGTLFDLLEELSGWYAVKVYVSKIAADLVEDAPPPVLPPPAVFRFTHWPTNDKRVNQAFGANPERYKQFGLPGHEGVDIAAAHDSPIYAAAAGTVAAVGDDRLPKLQGGHNYGVRVYIDHAAGYQSIYAHLNSRLVNVGDVVTAGQQIGKANNTGNSFGDHLHITLKLKGATAAGLTNYPLDIVDPTPFLAPLMGTPPAPGKIDLVPYFSPANGSKGDIAILKNNWGQGDERQQLQREGDNLYVTKNSKYELRKLRATTIDLVLDTSPGEENGVDRYYTVSGTWLPRQMAIGQSFTRTEHVKFFRKDNCQLFGIPYNSTSDIRLVMRHSVYQPEGGIVVNDVVELHWIVNGAVDERYFYGRGLGLIAWKKADGKRSWIVERIPLGQQEDNQREEIGCL